MSAGVANLFLLLDNFADKDTQLHFRKQFDDGTIRYSELKEQLTDDINAFLAPVQKTYRSLLDHPDQVRTILAEGAKKARPIAAETMQKTKKALGLG
jgi:tryptophanyl-tRNA synthetase